jgi:hypothetical protein
LSHNNIKFFNGVKLASRETRPEKVFTPMTPDRATTGHEELNFFKSGRPVRLLGLSGAGAREMSG